MARTAVKEKGQALQEALVAQSTPVVAKTIKEKSITIKPPKFEQVAIRIRGTAPYVQNKFSEKAKNMMAEKQRSGSTGNSKRKRDPKDFEQTYKDAQHVSRDGWLGIPASSFRNASISACRLVGFKMTIAKLSIFIKPDGFDATEGTPLIKITKGKPRVHEGMVRNETGVADIRWRPMWEEWEATLKIMYDAEQFTTSDIYNLISRVGMQVGIGEGRPDSPNSNGMGWGTFEIIGGVHDASNASAGE